MVYDLGGGTFDVSILTCEQGVYEVLASHGDTQLGGDDFDQLLFNYVCEEFHGVHDVDLKADRIASNRVLRAVEEAKKRLSDHAFTRIEEEFIAEKNGVPLHLNFELERSQFEELIQPLLDKTLDHLQKSLDDAKLSAARIDRVVLVGGSTKTPLVGKLIESKLGQPPHREVHPDLCVALGAGIQGGIIAGADVKAVLVDITPHSLGIRCLDVPKHFLEAPNSNRFAPIVRRNSPLPAKQSEVFCTVGDSQPSVEIDVYQGESDDVRRNHRVGKFLIEGLARVPAGNQIVVQLDLTLDGTLKVSAREKATGLVKQVVIDNALARFAVEERDAAAERINRLWDMPLDGVNDVSAALGAAIDEDDFEPAPIIDAEAHDGRRESVQARALIEKAERIRSKAAPQDQVEITRLMDNLHAALSARRWADVTTANNELSDVLFYLEDA
jgi:molecular chaperone DnaK